MRYMKEKRNRWVQKIGMTFAALFCMAVLALLPYSEVLANVEGTVTATSANIRASADPNSTALAGVLNGNKIEIIEEVTGTDNQKWYKVVINANSTGYIRADLVQKGEGTVPTGTLTPSTNTSPSPSPSPSTPNTNATVNTAGVVEVQPVSASVTKDQVRVRADSSTNASIITTLKKSVVLTVHGTKTGSGNDIWYYVSFVVDNVEMTGFIRSDFVTVNGELTPPEQAPAETPETPAEPVETPTQPEKKYETIEVDGVWYLLDNEAGNQYQLSKLFSASDQNATELENAQKKIKRQNGILIFLFILLVVLVLAVTVLFLKIRDMSEDDGFDFSFRRSSGSGNGGVRSSGTRPANGRPGTARSQGGTRPAQGSGGNRPAGASGGSHPAGASNGSRPAGASGGNRPAGTSNGSRPTGASMGNRPAGQGVGRPSGSSSTGSRPEGQSSRPVSQTVSDRAVEERVERQAQANVEARDIEKNMAGNQPRQPKNFMADDDEFEFEFLNWDGEES